MKITKNMNSVVRVADSLSLGISMVVSVIIGAVIGFYLKKWTGMSFFLYLFIGIGICSAFLNVYKVYKRQKKDFEELANDPKYKNFKPKFDDDDDDDK